MFGMRRGGQAGWGQGSWAECSSLKLHSWYSDWKTLPLPHLIDQEVSVDDE